MEKPDFIRSFQTALSEQLYAKYLTLNPKTYLQLDFFQLEMERQKSRSDCDFMNCLQPFLGATLQI